MELGWEEEAEPDQARSQRWPEREERSRARTGGRAAPERRSASMRETGREAKQLFNPATVLTSTSMAPPARPPLLTDQSNRFTLLGGIGIGHAFVELMDELLAHFG